MVTPDTKRTLVTPYFFIPYTNGTKDHSWISYLCLLFLQEKVLSRFRVEICDGRLGIFWTLRGGEFLVGVDASTRATGPLWT